MDTEQEKLGSFDPKQLIEQSGPDIGRITADEFYPGEITVEMPNGDQRVEIHPMIDGLPVIGSEAEHIARQNEIPAKDLDEVHRIHGGFSMMVRPKLTDHEAREKYYDKAGVEAMADEVARRAIEELVPNATKELQDAVGRKVASSFRIELAAKKTEKQTEANH